MYELILKHSEEYEVKKIEAPECDDWMFNQRNSFSKLIRLNMLQMLKDLKTK